MKTPVITPFRIVMAVLVSGLVLVGFAYATAVRRPLVREARVSLADWPPAEPPLRVVLASDLHVIGPDMPPERLGQIVEQINALRPDLVLFAGDFIGSKMLSTRSYSFDEALAPLRGLRSRLGSHAVLGNHDHWEDAAAASRALSGVGVNLLSNQAVRVGPLSLGGLDDEYTGHDDLPATLSAMEQLGGARLLLSHVPDRFPELPAKSFLMLAGHTHCGQIAPPLMGPLVTFSRHGTRYACGRVDERGNTLIVSAGLGTSLLPFRLGAVPDMWLLEVGPD
ncbi:MAG: metallophosphoesterase [Cystobacter sp.]